MVSRYVTLVLFGLTASLAVIVGGWIVSSRTALRHTVLNALVSLGAGFLLAATIGEVIPRSIGISSSAPAIILAGYLFVHLVEHTISTHFHFGEETHPEKLLNSRKAYSALGGLVLHSFFDGALIGAALWISMRLGILMFMAIILHKIPEGFTAASIVRASGRERWAAHAATVAVGTSTFFGVLSMGFSQALADIVLPFSAGVTLYVAASDLIPEVNRESGVSVSLGVFIGVVFFFLSESFLSRVL
ncbi:MAG TPA: ZIP family metal transporter [Acidobacteriota bacterium]|nr:ZIP family metal transporter [Acidobacteriota bacterium]